MRERPWHKHYDPGVGRTLSFTDTWLPEQLTQSADRFPGRPAIIFQNFRMSYRELVDHVDRLATALTALGVRQGDRVAIQLPNIPQCVIGYYAALRLGAVPSMTNPLYVPREIEYQWADCGAKVAIVADFIYDATIRAMRDRLPITDFIIASIPEYLRFPLNLVATFSLRRRTPPAVAKVERGPGIHFFRKLIRTAAPRPPRVTINGGDLAVLLYTGGTTGVSKGAMLTHRNLSCNVQQLVAWFPGLEPGREVQLAALPYFHSFGMTVAMTFPVAIGAALVLIPNPRDLRAVLEAIVRHRVTLAPMVPAMFNRINEYPGVDRLDLRSVKICNSESAPLPVDVLQRFEQLTRSKIAEGYGLTQTSPVAHCNPVLGLRKLGTIGVPLPGTDARILDLDAGTTDVPLGTVGELVLSGPQVMTGYWQRPEETANAMRNGWFYTGDLAAMDSDGYFRIAGRKKEMIIASGFKVFPDEVDRVLMSHEAVLEAATIGVPDERRGETVKSFVVLKPGKEATVEDLTRHCEGNLAPYKVPKEMEFLPELPRSAAMKILRRELKAEEMRRRETGKGKREK